ncbi:MAG: hypothetical protein GX891_02800 [Clostridiales bacterium]|nr:hypothetical protein [Clostridiales bacterium]
MKRFFYTLAQIIWGFPQTLAGFMVFLFTIGCPRKIFHGAVCTSWKLKSSLSLGLFIFVTDDPFFRYRSQKDKYSYDEFRNMIAVHEYGHTIQSLIWGPLYLLTVGAPSFIWANVPYFKKKRESKKISYFDVYPESQANKLGERATAMPSPGNILA